MIKIVRAACPRVIDGSPITGTKYNAKPVVKTLWKMQHGKCAYCEAPIPEEGHLKAVEHFRPKALFKNKKNDWNNLLLACAQCNGKKSNRFPIELTDAAGEPKVVYLKKARKAKAAIIDPCGDADPEEHIGFTVDDSDIELLGIPFAISSSIIGKETIDVVGLDQPHFVQIRQERFLHYLQIAYKNLCDAFVSQDKERIKLEKTSFRNLLSSKKPLAAFARSFARSKRPTLDKIGLTIPVGAEL